MQPPKPVELLLCQKLVEIISSILPPTIVVRGNFIPSNDGSFAGDDEISPSHLSVFVNPRAYDSYTSLVCSISVDLEGLFRPEGDPSLDNSVAAYDAIVSRLSLWHADIASVKRDLAVSSFSPVGLVLSGGKWEIDHSSLNREYSQSFTLKGRIIQ